MQKILKLIKPLALSPLIGLIPLYILWGYETIQVEIRRTPDGFFRGYDDPKVYFLHHFVGVCIVVSVLLIIPSVIATVTGIVLTIKRERTLMTKNLIFYLIPLILYLIIVLNEIETRLYTPFGALIWFMD